MSGTSTSLLDSEDYCSASQAWLRFENHLGNFKNYKCQGPFSEKQELACVGWGPGHSARLPAI